MKERTYIQKRICVCRKCSGTGTVNIYRKHDILRRDPIPLRCDLCEGSGRVTVQGVVDKEVLPYHGEHDWSAADRYDNPDDGKETAP